MSLRAHRFRIPPILPLLSTLLAVGCAESASDHPWLDLGADSPHRIVEFVGADAGQIVIAMDPTVSPEEAMELGRVIRDQAPPGATVNARLYDDEETARNWRTAPANMRVEHLQVVVSINPETGLDAVRWVRPDSLDAQGAGTVDDGSAPPVAPDTAGPQEDAPAPDGAAPP